MKLKLNMPMNILATIKNCFTLVIIQLSQNIMIIQTNEWLVKWNNETAGIAIEQFVGFKPGKDIFIFGR